MQRRMNNSRSKFNHANPPEQQVCHSPNSKIWMSLFYAKKPCAENNWKFQDTVFINP